MKIIKTDKVDANFVSHLQVFAPGICSQESYKDIGDMLKFNGLEDKVVDGTLYYDENGNWSISLSIKLKESK